MKTFCRMIAAVAALVAGSATCVLGQEEPRQDPRPPSAPGLFGGARQSAAVGESATAIVKLGQAYDQDVRAEIAGASASLFQGSGFYTTLTPQVQYQSGGRRLQFSINAASDARYYRDMKRLFFTTNSGDIGLMAQLTPSTSISLNQGVTYSSSLFSGLFPSSGAVATTAITTAASASSYPLDTNPSYTYSTSAALTQKLNGRSTIVFSSGLHFTNFEKPTEGYSNIRYAEGGAQYSYGLSRDVKLRFGYIFTKGSYAGSPQSTDQRLDIGVDYVRPLSKTRKTTVAFTFGPGVVNGALANERPDDIRRQYRLIGDVFVTHQMGRTWRVQGSGRRGLGFIQGFQSPVYTTSYSVSGGGFLTRRIDVSSSASYTSGEPALNGSQSQVATFATDAQVRFAMNEHFAAYVEYVFYDYQFDQQALQLSPLVPPRMRRNGLRIGLTTWIPMMRHR